MSALSPELDATPLAEAYHEFDRGLRISRAKVGYMLSLLLVPAGVTLDYFVYPDLKWPILRARLMCDLALVPWFVLACTPFGHRYIRLLDKPCAILPSLAICWMIYASEGAVSPYYAGLNLIMVGVCLVMPYTTREGMLFCAIIAAVYAAACLLHTLQTPASLRDAGHAELFNNLYFIALTSIICVTACYYSSRRRFEDFRLRHELHVNNDQLQTTLVKLQKAEVQLVQSEKMNALGKLSAGLLHEINNPLNFTFMALKCAEQEVAGNAEVLDTLKDIGEGMSRIRTVISDLRAFAYPATEAHSEIFSIDEALTTAMRLMSQEMGDIQIDRTGVGDSRAMGVKTQVVHVLMNMLVNSVQAVKAEKSGRPHQIAISCAKRNDRLVVTVRDNGIGVKAADLPRLCEPFFTTKEVGQGTGLGLSISHAIVKNHGGELLIASEEGQWTEVSFDLPLPVAGGKT